MSGQPWGKFFWSDWESDPALKLCSLAAQGLWMRMLCIMAQSEPTGYLAVAGESLGPADLSVMIGTPEPIVTDLLAELDRRGVFSRNRAGRIYSRRMVRDAIKAANARKNGKLGGNPKLGKDKEISASDNLPDKGGDKPQKLEARGQNQKEENTKLSPQSSRAQGADPGRASIHPDDPRAPATAAEVMRIAGMITPPRDMHLAADWLKAGADPVEHIYPVVERLSAAMRTKGRSIGSFGYFAPAVDEARTADDREVAAYAERIGKLRDPAIEDELQRGAEEQRQAEEQARARRAA